MTDVDVPSRPSRRLPTSVAAAVVVAALGVGVVGGYQLGATDRPGPAATSVEPGNGPGGSIVVEENAEVIRMFTAEVGERLTLIHVPHIVVESWADHLVSSDPSVVEVLDDVTIRTVGAGSADLRIATDDGTERTLYRVTVTD